MFTANVPMLERAIRALAGAAIIGYALLGAPSPSIALIVVGSCVALTGLIGFCPACAIAGRKLRDKTRQVR
jgi:hypothetical protein